MRKIIIMLLLWIPLASVAQISGVLTYEEAVALTLKNNFDILIAKNNAEIAAVENNLGYAGFLPKFDINSNGNFANNRTKQEFSSGQSVDKSGVISKNITAGGYLSYTLFDGFKMFATKERLSLLEQQGELNFKIQIENTLEQLTLYYYQIVKQEQLIKGIRAAMTVSEERIKVAQKKLQIGSGSNVELLQAKLDLNEQKSNLILQKSILKENKNNLTYLMQEKQNTAFSVDTNFAFESIESVEDIRLKIENNNRSVMFAKKNIEVTKQIIRELKSQSLPRVGVSSSYVFGRNSNTAGFALFTQNLGYSAGFNFSWNLFNGFIVRNQVQVAQIELQNNLLNVDRVKAVLYSESNSAYTRWLGDRETLQLEEENIKLAEQSLYIMLERMRIGLGNYLETKESQSSYEAAITRLVTARYNLKASETTLKKITGEFIK
ncbi:MAG: TolC family protein [Chitinophagaceae bacterium]|nr:TolC family protein [Chitinophagaceae bacterium]